MSDQKQKDEMSKFTCPCGETTYTLEKHPNHYIGCIVKHHMGEGKSVYSSPEMRNLICLCEKLLKDTNAAPDYELREVMIELDPLFTQALTAIERKRGEMGHDK